MGPLLPPVKPFTMKIMLSIVTAPEMPLTADEIRTHLRDTSIDTTAAELFALTALGYAQAFTRRAISTQTWDLVLDVFPIEIIQVPLPPLQEVESMTYIDGDGVSQLWPENAYTVDTVGNRIVPAYGTFFPVTRAVPNAVTVRFVAGYQDAPFPIKAAMLLICGDVYLNREAQQDARLYKNETVDRLLWPYRWL